MDNLIDRYKELLGKAPQVLSGIVRSQLPQNNILLKNPITDKFNKAGQKELLNTVREGVPAAIRTSSLSNNRPLIGLGTSFGATNRPIREQLEDAYKGGRLALTALGGRTVSPGQLASFPLIGGAFNKATGGSFLEGAGRSAPSTLSLSAVGSITNPMIERYTKLLSPKFSGRLSSLAGEGATRGLLNIPEGAAMDAALGRRPLDPASLAVDFATGFIPGGGRAGSFRKLGRATDTVSSVSKTADDELVLPNNEAKVIGQLANKMDRIRNISINETNTVRELAQKYLKLPNQEFAQMSTDQLLAELRSLMTTDQRYAYDELIRGGQEAFKGIPKLSRRQRLGNAPKPTDLDELRDLEIPKLVDDSAIDKYTDDLIDNEVRNAVSGQPGIRGGDDVLSQARKQIGEEPTRTESLRQTWRNLYRDWVNRFQPIEDVAKQVEKAGVRIDPKADPRITTRQLLGAGGIAELRHRQKLEPVLDQINVPKEDFDVFLKAKRDVELGQRGIKGSDPQQAQTVIQELGRKYNLDNMNQVAEQLYRYQDESLQMLRNAGFIDEAGYQAIRDANRNYVPFQRVMDKIDNYLGLPTTKAQQATSPINKIKGSERQVLSPLESIIANTYKTEAAVAKNRVAKSLVELQNLDPKFKGMFPKVEKSGNDTISVWENGQKNYYQVGNEIADVVRGLNEENMSTIFRILSAPARLLRQGATGRNIDFMIPNVFKDQFDAAVSSKYGYIPFVDYLRGLGHVLNYKFRGQDDVVEAWMRSGGSIFFENMGGRKQIRQQIQDATQQKKLTRKLWDWAIGGIDFIGDISEKPTRVGLFQRALAKTGSPDLAMLESRDSTVDFARMGAKMKTANSIIPFLNVGVQGFDKLVRAAKDHPGRFTVMASIYAGLPATMTALYNNLNFPEEYADIPQWEKDTNFVIVTGRGEDGKPTYLKFPKGNVVPFFANPIENFITYRAGVDPRSFGELAINLLADALPIVEGGENVTQAASRTVGSNLPQALKPSVEGLANYNFFYGDSIVPWYMENKPAHEQVFESTPEIYKRAGILTNTSPLKVKNFTEGSLAGFAKMPLNAANTLKSITDNEPVNINEVPILRRFVGQRGYAPGERVEAKLEEQQSEEIKNLDRPSRLSALNPFAASASNEEVVDTQDRAGKLREKKQLSIAKKRVELQGGIQEVGDYVVYEDDEGSVRTLNFSKYAKKVKGVEKIQQDKDKRSLAKRIVSDQTFTPEQKSKYLKRLDITRTDALYDYYSGLDNDEKTAVLVPLMQGREKDSVLRSLAIARQKGLSGDILAANGVLDNLVDAGILTKEEAKALKKVESGKKGTITIKQSGGSGRKAKRIKISIPKGNASSPAGRRPRLKLLGQSSVRLNTPSLR